MFDRNNPYFKQAELLVRVLPFIAEKECFAIKGVITFGCVPK